MFDSNSFYDFANLLARKTSPKEYETRTAINRFYQSMLILAKEKLEQRLGKTYTITNNIHREIIEELKSQNSKLGDELGALRDYQLDSDYEFDSTVEHTTALHCSGISKHLKKRLGSL